MRYINGNTFVRGVNAVSEASDQGLPIFPQITGVIGGSVPTNMGGHILILLGFNFHPQSEVCFSSGTIIIEELEFINPSRIVLTIETEDEEGVFDILVKNGSLDSGTSGNGLLVVQENAFVDLRTIDLDRTDIERTSGVTIAQDEFRGLSAGGTGAAWNRGLRFNDFNWNRADNVNFEFVFTRTGAGLSMFGIGGGNINLNGLGNQSFFEGETKMFLNGSLVSTFFGGGQQANWTQNIGTTIATEINKFYKVVFENSGASGSQMQFFEVDENNFNVNVNLLHSWISNNPATDTNLFPFWAAPNNSTFYVSAFRIF